VLNKASNDSEFRRSVSRACPLRTTFTRIEGHPSTLILYKIKASSYWQCRFFHGGKMIVKSTREKQLDDAKRFAVALYQTHTGSSASNKGLDDQRGEQSYFKNIATQMLSREAARRDRGELADLSYRADKTRLETEIIPFFGDLSIASITEQQIQSFYSKIESRRLSSTTLSLYLMTLRKVLKYARTSNLIQSIPIIPSVKIRKRSRGSFTPTEYVRLIRSARRLIGTPVILQAVNSAVLWLLGTHELARRNLHRRAEEAGVTANRIIFANHLPVEQHLNRIRHGEVFLDTYPYSAHTTASDALRMGVPLITLRGMSFASRVASSILKELGLTELITDSLDAYKSLAIRLGTDPQALKALKQRVLIAAKTSNLFDPQRYSKELEAIYEQLLLR
jgi:hypothetical protein